MAPKGRQSLDASSYAPLTLDALLARSLYLPLAKHPSINAAVQASIEAALAAEPQPGGVACLLLAKAAFIQALEHMLPPTKPADSSGAAPPLVAGNHEPAVAMWRLALRAAACGVEARSMACLELGVLLAAIHLGENSCPLGPEALRLLDAVQRCEEEAAAAQAATGAADARAAEGGLGEGLWGVQRGWVDPKLHYLGSEDPFRLPLETVQTRHACVTAPRDLPIVRKVCATRACHAPPGVRRCAVRHIPVTHALHNCCRPCYKAFARRQLAHSKQVENLHADLVTAPCVLLWVFCPTTGGWQACGKHVITKTLRRKPEHAACSLQCRGSGHGCLCAQAGLDLPLPDERISAKLHRTLTAVDQLRAERDQARTWEPAPTPLAAAKACRGLRLRSALWFVMCPRDTVCSSMCRNRGYQWHRHH